MGLHFLNLMLSKHMVYFLINLDQIDLISMFQFDLPRNESLANLRLVRGSPVCATKLGDGWGSGEASLGRDLWFDTFVHCHFERKLKDQGIGVVSKLFLVSKSLCHWGWEGKELHCPYHEDRPNQLHIQWHSEADQEPPQDKDMATSKVETGPIWELLSAQRSVPHLSKQSFEVVQTVSCPCHFDTGSSHHHTDEVPAHPLEWQLWPHRSTMHPLFQVP